jgi:hypothetical protein
VDSRPDIEWGSAEVQCRKLTVWLTSPPSAAWRERARRLIDRLQRGDPGWGRVRAKKDRFVVREVIDGSEQDVRHFLSSVVAEVNAGEPEPHGGHDETDARMAARFRSFAEPTE